MKTNKPTPMYNLIWEVQGQKRETIEWNKPAAICNWKKKQLKSNYRYGELKLEKVK